MYIDENKVYIDGNKVRTLIRVQILVRAGSKTPGLFRIQTNYKFDCMNQFECYIEKNIV